LSLVTGWLYISLPTPGFGVQSAPCEHRKCEMAWDNVLRFKKFCSVCLTSLNVASLGIVERGFHDVVMERKANQVYFIFALDVRTAYIYIYTHTHRFTCRWNIPINTSDYTTNSWKHQVRLLKLSAFLLNYCEI
jgi:hypothetical protein